jgi:hypothetical protein
MSRGRNAQVSRGNSAHRVASEAARAVGSR